MKNMCDSELQETFVGILNNPEIKITYMIGDKEVTKEEFYKDSISQPTVTKKFTNFRYDIWDNDREETIKEDVKIKEQYKYSERTKII